MKSDDYEEPGFLQRYGFALGVGGVAVVGAAVFAGQMFSGHKAPPPRMHEITMVKLLPQPPPPPPPPPKLQEPKPAEDKMIEQPPVDDNEPKPDDKPKEQPAPGPVGTNIKGNGSADGFGLGGSGGFLGGNGGGGSQGGRWGWYAARVQMAIGEALRRNDRTREAAFRIEVRIWPDSVGRIQEAQLVDSTGDPRLDNAIKGEVLTGLQLSEPPPDGMPTPIVLRLSARRPN